MQVKNVLPVILVGVFATAAATAHATVLYSSINAAQTVASLDRPHIPASSGDFVGQGDDYGTASSAVVVTGLSFKGALGGNTALTIDFYSKSGLLLSSVTPTATEVPTTNVNTTYTLGAADFGPNGLTLPGVGEVLFAISPIDPLGSRPTFVLNFSGSGAPSVGSNDLTVSNQLDYTGALTTGRYYNGIGGVPVNQLALFELDGTAVPEPASLGLLVPAALMMLKRRRRQA